MAAHAMGEDIELAVLFADVVGSTRLYERMGDQRARDMVSLCIELMRNATEQHAGTVVKTMGDEVMATFPSADEALNAAAALDALTWCDGVMLGREAYHRPRVLTELHRALAPQVPVSQERALLLERMARYAERRMLEGEPLQAITRHMLGLCAGEPGAKEFRRLLSEGARAAGAGPALIRRAASVG